MSVAIGPIAVISARTKVSANVLGFSGKAEELLSGEMRGG